MKKRKLVLLAAVAVLVIGLASCAGQKKKYRFGGCGVSMVCIEAPAHVAVA